MLTINKDNFTTEVENFSGIFVLLFSSVNCVNCRLVCSELDKLKDKAYKLPTKYGKVDVYSDMDLAMNFNVTSLPSVFLLRDNVTVFKLNGVNSSTVYDSMLTKLCDEPTCNS